MAADYLVPWLKASGQYPETRSGAQRDAQVRRPRRALKSPAGAIGPPIQQHPT
jgi:hypothetical protein